MRGKKTSMKICEISDVKQLRSMTIDTNFSCAKCGAKSHDSAYLCEPVSSSGDSSAIG